MDTVVTFRVEELAVAAGVSVDTIRFYQGRGLLPRPRRQGRVAVYEQDHLLLLERIRELADDGFTLAQITDLVGDGADPLLSALAATDAADLDGGVTFDELVERSGLSPKLVAAAVAAGLVQPIEPSSGPDRVGTDGARFDEAAVQMVSAAGRLLGAGVPLDALSTLALRHAEEVDHLVADAVEVFRSHVKGRAADRVELATLTTELVPVVSQLVADHFSRTLVRHARALLTDEPDGATTGGTDEPAVPAS